MLSKAAVVDRVECAGQQYLSLDDLIEMVDTDTDRLLNQGDLEAAMTMHDFGERLADLLEW